MGDKGFSVQGKLAGTTQDPSMLGTGAQPMVMLLLRVSQYVGVEGQEESRYMMASAPKPARQKRGDIPESRAVPLGKQPC